MLDDKALCILVTSDDGIQAPGLLALASAMREFGKVIVFGPEENQSANGPRKTLTNPLRVTPPHLADGTPAYSTDGAPADCIALAWLGYVPEQVDLVVAGINRGQNLGQDLTYSGTIAAAFEGTIYRKSSVAFSLNDRSREADYAPSAEIARRVIKQVIAHGLPIHTLLNVNIPNLPLDQLAGLKITRQGTSVYHDELIRRLDPDERPYYWIGGKAPTRGISPAGADIRGGIYGLVSGTRDPF